MTPPMLLSDDPIHDSGAAAKRERLVRQGTMTTAKVLIALLAGARESAAVFAERIDNPAVLRQVRASGSISV